MTTPCMIWKNAINGGGYGQAYHQGKQISAHRQAWVSAFGTIKEGMCVLHKCDNKLCVNPDHLFLGTHSDNVHDMKKKGRHPSMKLTELQVRLILSASGSQREVADLFDVSQSLISRIKRGEYWKHVTNKENTQGASARRAELHRRRLGTFKRQTKTGQKINADGNQDGRR